MKNSINLLCLILAASTLAACSTYDKAVEKQRAVYKSAEKRDQGLEVPPDLTQQSDEDQFSIPNGPGATSEVTASSYYSNRGQGVAVAAQQPVLVQDSDLMVKQIGDTRSLVVKNMTPAQVWPVLKSFWTKQGFNLTTVDPKIGVMETDWKENRAAIPMDGVRKLLGKVIDGLYSSNQRDRFLTRVERTTEGGTEIFVTHRGLEEQYTSKDQTDMRWVPRKADPELEAIMLNRLMVQLTGDENAGKDVKTSVQKALITVEKDAAKGPQIVIGEEFPEAWRRVGIGLDRSGFIVEDRDRANGVYYVRYAPDSAAGSEQEPGFFGKLFGQRSGDRLISGQRYQVIVENKGNKTCVARFESEKGGSVSVKVATQAVEALAPQMQ